MGARAEGQSLKATGLEIVERLNARWDVRLDLIIQNEALSLEQRRQMLIARMLERALADIDEQSLNMDVEPAVLAAENQALIERAVRGDAPEVEVNFAITEHNFKILRDYTGGQVTDYITRLCKRFEAMSRAKTPGELALEIFGSSLVCVGTAMGKLTFAAWRAGQPLLTAIRAGVTGIGMKTAVAVVIIVLAALLLYLFLENPKKILGLIVNDTDDDLVVKDWRKGVDGGAGGDLWMEHGHMANFPEDHASGDLQLAAGPGPQARVVGPGRRGERRLRRLLLRRPELRPARRRRGDAVHLDDLQPEVRAHVRRSLRERQRNQHAMLQRRRAGSAGPVPRSL